MSFQTTSADNFTHLIFGIIIISVLPGIIGFIRQKMKKAGPAA